MDLVLLLHPVLHFPLLWATWILFFFFLPPPWPSVSQCFLLASSMRDSGLSPFPFWEVVRTFWVFSRLPLIHLPQHLHIFPDLQVVFLDQQLGFKSREDYVSLLVSNIYGDCIY